MFVDVHSHLSFPQFDDDRDDVIKRMLENGITYLIDPGTDALTSRKSIELADLHPFIKATVGLHPHEVTSMPENTVFDELQALLQSDNVVGVGEIGLDYHYPDINPQAQQEAFRTMLNMAMDHDLPVVIHSRDAWQDTLDILRQERRPNLRGIMHCFSGNSELATECIRLGLSISIPGTITYKKSQLPDVVRSIDMEHILTETDAPYLAPVPFRGKRNEPAYVRYVTAAIAELRQLPLEETAHIVSRNAIRLFGEF
ncbi:MAG: TatD family hydrolase [Prosthecochloris sp.]|nr:TatD family hydrolase [Prosthecochloris sp.]